MMAGGDVVDLGAGCGCYTAALLDWGTLRSVAAFDGSPGIDNVTDGLVQPVDLTWNLTSWLRPHHWTLCLEVGEHVSRRFESTVFANLVARVSVGVVLSWAEPDQPGLGHVNLHTNEYVILRMKLHGFLLDRDATKLLRAAATLFWFKRTIMAFQRSSTLPV